MSINVHVLLPAYNEQGNIGPLLEQYVQLAKSQAQARPERKYKVLIVDDGSSDKTVETAETFKDKLDLAIEKHGQNRGLGPAVRTGLNKILERAELARTVPSQDIVVTMDADNSHPPELIPSMIDKIEKGYDLVIASRYVEGGKELGLARHRSLLSWGCSQLLKQFFPIPGVRDYTCGYRAFKMAKLKKLADKTQGEFYKEDSFVSVNEFLLQMAKLGLRATEVPLVLRYDLKLGKSKMKVLSTVLRYFLLILRV